MKIIFNRISDILGLIAALFLVMGIFMPRINESIKAKCRNILKTINESQWMQLPEIMIEWFLNVIKRFERILHNLTFSWLIFYKSVRSKHKIINYIYLMIIGVLFFFGIKLNFGPTFLIQAFLVSLILSLVLVFNDLFLNETCLFLKNFPNLTMIKDFILSIPFEIYNIGTIVLWYFIFIESKLYNSFFLCIIFYLTILIIMLFGASRIICYFIGNPSVLFIIFASFMITLTSFLIGNLIHSNLWIPKTTLMLISNMIFDILTIYITIYILRWAIRDQKIYKIPVAVLMDIFFASLLACFSLFFGLIFSDKSLSIMEILNIFIAKSPDGNNFEFGPYFWVMHTTFIPTVLYLQMIIFSWFVKIILIPTVWFFGEIESKNPFHVFAGIFGLLSAFFKLLVAYL